jgi:hypothetical protein
MLGTTTGSVGRVAQALGLNSVPVVGLFFADWSTGTALALYWIESLIATLLIAVRIVVHRRLTRKAGHWQVVLANTPGRRSADARRGRGTLLGSFLTVMLVFTGAHGLFLAILVFWARTLDRFGRTPAGETFSDYWRRTAAEERAKQEANERPLPAEDRR